MVLCFQEFSEGAAEVTKNLSGHWGKKLKHIHLNFHLVNGLTRKQFIYKVLELKHWITM